MLAQILGTSSKPRKDKPNVSRANLPLSKLQMLLAGLMVWGLRSLTPRHTIILTYLWLDGKEGEGKKQHGNDLILEVSAWTITRICYFIPC